MIVQSSVILFAEQSVKCLCTSHDPRGFASHDEGKLICAGSHNSAHMVEHHVRRVAIVQKKHKNVLFVCMKLM